MDPKVLTINAERFRNFKQIQYDFESGEMLIYLDEQPNVNVVDITGKAFLDRDGALVALKICNIYKYNGVNDE